MNYNYTLKYRTFDSLLEDVKLSMRNMTLENKIFPEDLIKIAQRINYNLGQRIYMTKEVVLDICNGQAKLPDDFYIMNFALMCGEYTKEYILPQGTNIQEVPYPLYREYPPDTSVCTPATVNCVKCNSLPCNCSSASCLTTVGCPIDPPTPTYDPLQPFGPYCTRPRVFLDCKGNSQQLIQIINTQKRTYNYLFPIRFRKSQFIDCDCPNLKQMNTINEAYIKDGFLYANVNEGHIYINYQGQLEDENGNLLVLDHNEINMYYEYALKERILETLIMDGENLVPQYQLVTGKLREAKNAAMNIVNKPNFSEMLNVWAMNRKAMYARYYNMFKPYFYPVDFRINNAV